MAISNFKLKFSRFLSLIYRITRILRHLLRFFSQSALIWIRVATVIIAMCRSIETFRRGQRLWNTKRLQKGDLGAFIQLGVFLFLIALTLIIEASAFIVLSANLVFYSKLSLLASIFLLALSSRIRGGSRAAKMFYTVEGEVKQFENFQANIPITFATPEFVQYLSDLKAHQEYLRQHYNRMLVKTWVRSVLTSLSIGMTLVALFFPALMAVAAITSLSCGLAMLGYKIAMYFYKDHYHPPKDAKESQPPAMPILSSGQTYLGSGGPDTTNAANDKTTGSHLEKTKTNCSIFN